MKFFVEEPIQVLTEGEVLAPERNAPLGLVQRDVGAHLGDPCIDLALDPPILLTLGHSYEGRGDAGRGNSGDRPGGRVSPRGDCAGQRE